MVDEKCPFPQHHPERARSIGPWAMTSGNRVSLTVYPYSGGADIHVVWERPPCDRDLDEWDRRYLEALAQAMEALEMVGGATVRGLGGEEIGEIGGPTHE
jgi:hypothetical protein